MSVKKKMIQVGCGGFGAYWLEVIMPRVNPFAEVVAAVDVNEAALKMRKNLLALNRKSATQIFKKL